MDNYDYRQLMRRIADFKLCISIVKDAAIITACAAVIYTIVW